jgi:Ca2+-binding EF-hand superfamily protein
LVIIGNTVVVANKVATLRLLLVNKISSVKKLKQIFNRLDKDKSGAINLKEFRKLCKYVDKNLDQDTLLQIWSDCWDGEAHNRSTEMNLETLEAYLF